MYPFVCPVYVHCIPHIAAHIPYTSTHSLTYGCKPQTLCANEKRYRTKRCAILCMPDGFGVCAWSLNTRSVRTPFRHKLIFGPPLLVPVSLLLPTVQCTSHAHPASLLPALNPSGHYTHTLQPKKEIGKTPNVGCRFEKMVREP